MAETLKGSMASNSDVCLESGAKPTGKNGKRVCSYDTVELLAEDLGLAINTSCDRDDASCIKDVIKTYKHTTDGAIS